MLTSPLPRPTSRKPAAKQVIDEDSGFMDLMAQTRGGLGAAAG